MISIMGEAMDEFNNVNEFKYNKNFDNKYLIEISEVISNLPVITDEEREKLGRHSASLFSFKALAKQFKELFEELLQ
jgi:hypothetical protein